MQLVIDVADLAEADLLKISENDTVHRSCSKYLGFLNKKIKEFLAADGYRQVSTTGGLEYSMFLYKNNKGRIRKVKNSLSVKKKDQILSSWSIEFEDSTRVATKLEALFKSIEIPSVFVHLVN
tara:strand:- start:120 stop:488 length:369 start_codon:yes stop_codon:yes gene_type:complete